MGARRKRPGAPRTTTSEPISSGNSTWAYQWRVMTSTSRVPCLVRCFLIVMWMTSPTSASPKRTKASYGKDDRTG